MEQGTLNQVAHLITISYLLICGLQVVASVWDGAHIFPLYQSEFTVTLQVHISLEVEALVVNHLGLLGKMMQYGAG